MNMKNLITCSKDELFEILCGSDLHIYRILKKNTKLHDARSQLLLYFNNIDKHLFNIYSDKQFEDLNILEKKNARDCIRVLKSTIRSENEKETQFSALKALSGMVTNNKVPENITKGFLCEFIFLFRGINGRSGLYSKKETPQFLALEGREAALERTKFLDEYAQRMKNNFRKYQTGLDKNLINERDQMKEKILQYFNAHEEDWTDYNWHLKHIISDIDTLKGIIKLDENELMGLEMAKENEIIFQITPYYLSLFDRKNNKQYDHSIRAQVLPSINYCSNYIKSIDEGLSLDFMEEESTSPIKGITRRYPNILIIKPYDSCPQICVYCQRNWEIKSIKKTDINKQEIMDSINWVADNPYISEVLVTGGDPLTMNDRYLDLILEKLSDIEHVERIRIGTRTLVTLPFRFTDNLVDIFSKYHKLGVRELCIITHFQHPTEITPDVLDAVLKIKQKGMNIYNQQVFTYYNSKRFESCLLRETMKKSGIDPYYTFNTKGKKETQDYRVPISRIEQEREEEARLLPGLERTDEPVFNVPRLGKSHLRSWQNHEVIMILPDGRRVYRFYPWEYKFELVEPYNYADVSIYDYIERLYLDGEDIGDYSSIWYYF